MFEGTSFGKTLNILERSMDVATLRRGVIANNISNAETPDFKRSDVNFEAELGRALASEEEARSNMQAHTSHGRHIPFTRAVDYRSVKPRIVLDYLTEGKNNGNNVDIEQEMLNATENQMMYELTAAAVSHQFKSINMVLR